METQVKQSRIELSPSVMAGLNILSYEQKNSILNAIHSLEQFSKDKITDNIEKATVSGRTFYMLRATPLYRIIFEIEEDGDRLEIIDLFEKDRLKLFREHRD